MNRYLFSLLFFGVFTSLRAESPQSNVKGVLILTSASGNTPISIPFTDISFSDFDGGVVMDASGAKQAFPDHDIGKVLYLDENFYSSLHQDSNFLKYANGFQSREILVSLNFPRISTPEDLSAIQSAKDTLDDIQAHYPQAKEFLQPYVDVLNSDLSRYGQHQVFVNGNWTSADQTPAPPIINSKTTFTAKNGKVYTNVKVFVTDAGVSVLTEDGGTTIPFDQLPDDLTVFPKSIAGQILAYRKSWEASQASAGTTPSNTATNNNSTNTNTPANSPVARTDPAVGGFSSSDLKTMQGLRALLLSKIQEQVQDLQKALEPPHQPSQGYPDRQNHYGQSSQQNDPLQQENVLNTFQSNNHDSLPGPSRQSSFSQNSAEADQQKRDNIRTQIEDFSLAETRLISLPPAQVGVEIVYYADSIDAQARMGQSLGQIVSNVGTDMINAPGQLWRNTQTGEITETDDSGGGVLGLAFGAMMQINAQAKKDEVDKIRAALESLTPSARTAIATALRAQPKQSN